MKTERMKKMENIEEAKQEAVEEKMREENADGQS